MVWAPDEEDLFLPGENSLKEGESYKVDLGDGEITTVPSKNLRPCDPKCLEPIDGRYQC